MYISLINEKEDYFSLSFMNKFFWLSHLVAVIILDKYVCLCIYVLWLPMLILANMNYFKGFYFIYLNFIILKNCYYRNIFH